MDSVFYFSNEPPENVFLTLVRNSEHLTLKQKRFLSNKISDFNSNNSLNTHHFLWEIIHSMHKENANTQLLYFNRILKILKKISINCSCDTDALEIFKGITRDELDNFINLSASEFQDFWIFFHNQINEKLNKDIFFKNQ